MPANFGILQGVAPPQVIASLPTQAPSNSIDSLAGGLMSGLAQGQQLQANALQMAATRQNMEQQAELFPGQKQIQQQTIESNQMAIDDAKAKQQTAAEMKANYAISQKQGDEWFQQNDPVGYAKMMVDRGTYTKSIAEAAKASAETIKQQLANATEMQIAGANMVIASDKGRTPEEKQAIYETNRNYLVSQSPELAKLYPENPTEWQKHNMVVAGMGAIIRQKEKEEMDSLDSRAKNTLFYEKRRETLDEELQKAMQEGKDTTKIQQKIRDNEQGYSSLRSNRQTTSTDTYETEFDKELGKKNATTIGEIQDANAKLDTYIDVSNLQLERLGEVPNIALGPFQKATGMWRLSGPAQAYASSVSAATLLAKDILGLKGGTQGFTEGERQFVEEAAGNTGSFKGTLPEIITGMQYLAKKAKLHNWERSNSIMQQHSGQYESWLQSNPRPEDPGTAPEFMSKFGKGAEQSTAPAVGTTKELNGVTYILKEDGWHTK